MTDKIKLQDYDNIIFDYGGVIVNLEDDFARKQLLSLGVSKLRIWWYRKRFKQLIRDFIDGLRPTDDIIDDVLKVMGNSMKKDDLQPFIDSLTGELPVSRLKMIKELRKTHKVYLLSNINDVLWDNAVNDMKKLGYTPEELFDDTFLSFQMHIAKPDIRIYEKVIELSGVNPQRTVFFDDRKANVESACKAGLHGILIQTNHLENEIE